jgi:Cys-tRNA(Pro)/Cys-tRNA(Cys) deacylase
MKAPHAAIEAEAMNQALVYINGGKRGLQVRLSLKDAATVLKAVVAPLVA